MFDVSVSAHGTKDLVFRLLLREFPQTIAELHRGIKTQYDTALTYQAVRKAVLSLTEGSMLVRDGKQYQISKEWLLATKSSVDQLLLAYDERRNRAAAMAQLVSEDHSVFTLHSLYELDNFWGDVFKTCYQKISPDDPRGIVCCWHYTWWLVFNFGRETDLFGSAVRQGYCIENRIFYDLPLNRWAAEVYRSVGAEVKIGKNPDLDDSVAFNMIGDDILQVEYPSSVMKVIAPMFQDYEHLHDIDQKAVTDLAHARHDIRFSMFTNSVIADQLRRTYQCL